MNTEIIKNSAKIFEKQILKGNINLSNMEIFDAVIKQLSLPLRWKSKIIYLRNKRIF